jgi:hypothetical protein
VVLAYTEQSSISKKPGNIFQVPDVNIFYDGMAIVKMKAVIKMIGISQYKNS